MAAPIDEMTFAVTTEDPKTVTSQLATLEEVLKVTLGRVVTLESIFFGPELAPRPADIPPSQGGLDDVLKTVVAMAVEMETRVMRIQAAL